jgi:hypothetical protein
MNYRNKLFLPEVDAGTACRHCSSVTSPVANKIPSGPSVGGEATAIVVVLPSPGSRSVALAAVGHLPEHLTGLVQRDLSWQSRKRGVGVPTEVQDLAFFAGSFYFT